ncbi:hypothetical protein NC652_035735 [Populus alba x Populus x berolinensis]|nr:hypothetical protein NC652_035735 [Populus alba x Populus x berolinensis]
MVDHVLLVSILFVHGISPLDAQIPQNKSPSNSITFNLIDEEAEGLMDTQEVEREIKDTAVLVHNLHRRKEGSISSVVDCAFHLLLSQGENQIWNRAAPHYPPEVETDKSDIADTSVA